eukprot:maker-scaffold_8-snap-gene-4.6-mRNA-1 protein AED:0.05 eAED:0.05 QI:49/1/0.87/1/1/1/8/106/517
MHKLSQTISPKLINLVKNHELIRSTSFIGGIWSNELNDRSFPVENPSTLESLANMTQVTSGEIDSSITEAQAAFKRFKKTTGSQRSKLLRTIGDLHREHIEDLATILTIECGKPLAEAKGEVLYGASYFDWFSEEAKRIYGDTIPDPVSSRRIIVTKEPIGVCGIITPWNFPNAMLSRKLSAALAAGCTTLIKPAAETPFSALALGVLFEEASKRCGMEEVCKGVVNILLAGKDDARIVSEAWMKSSVVKKISFTGSTPVGKLLAEQGAKTLKKFSLELGGNAPFIVFDDADLEAYVLLCNEIFSAAEGLMASKFRNAGQTCVCANRVFIDEKVSDEFFQIFKHKVEALRVGDGLQDDVTIGPLISNDAVAKCNNLLQDAVKKGASMIHKAGTTTSASNGYFFPPTVVSNIKKDMDIAHEEIFGPIVAATTFKTEEEAIDLANSTPFGLASYFYARDVGRVFRVKEELEYGMVGVNTGVISTEVAPFGGVKESGYGREGSKYGIDDYLQTKYMALNL